MTGNWGFVIWILLMGVPIGIVLSTVWARSRGAGGAMLDKPGADDPRDPI